MRGVARRRALLIGLTALAAATPARAQPATPRAVPRPEMRLDYLGGEGHAVHGAAGLNFPVGTYLRVGVVAGGGAAWHDGQTFGSARADVIGRFALDPFRERRWGLSAGGGVSARYDYDPARLRRRWRAFVAIALDLEGARLGPIAPAIQVGLGGGARIGIIVRGADPFRR